MRIILLGAPGSGKGTQARRLVDNYKVPQISTGDLLRAAAEEGSEIGRTAERLMKEGALVPDSLVIELVSQRMLKPDTRRGFILDGFPRNIPQAQELDTRLGWVSRPIQMVINFEVEETVLVQRLTGRRNCKKCGAIYNIYFDPPRVRDRCDDCGAALSVRDDDNEETVRSRLVVYHQQTELLVQYYRAQHKLRTLNANGDPGGHIQSPARDDRYRDPTIGKQGDLGAWRRGTCDVYADRRRQDC
jgi:adenylate kinase